MKITLAAIGRAKPGPERMLYEHYTARLTWPVTLKECEDKKSGGTIEQRKMREAVLLRAASEGCAFRIALDERGKNLTSATFARYLQQAEDRGEGNIALLIGGADGLDDRLRDDCRLVLSLGQLTWPHMLVRGLMAEQLYRAQTILTNHPYHRE